MFILDNLFIGGLRFVLDKIAVAAEQEMETEERLHDDLLAAQMQLEVGEISEKQFAAIERKLLKAIREIRVERQGGGEPSGTLQVAGIETDFGEEES